MRRRIRLIAVIVCIVALTALLVGGCMEPVSMDPALELQFRRMNDRVQALAVKCDPNDLNASPACIYGWEVFATDLQVFVDAMDGKEAGQ